MWPRLVLASVLCLGVAAPSVSGRPSLQNAARPPHAAQALDVTLTWPEFDRLVLDRHALTEVGRGALNHLLRAKLLDRLAQESKLVVKPSDVDQRWNELEREVVQSGQAASLDEYLRKNRVDKARFREFLRLGVVQETLARQALGIPSGRAINGEQQEMWLDQIVQQRGAQLCPPPWSDGVAARCGDLEVKLPEFLDHLVQQLTIDDVQDDCFQALLAKRVRARMPDLSEEAFDRAIEVELNRRRIGIESEARYKGASFEQILASQGLSVPVLRRDPVVIASALAHVWVDRTHGEDGLRRAYTEERDWFDRHFGEARHLKWIFLRGARFKSDLTPRTFEDAERELNKLAGQIKASGDFERLAKARSEDAATRTTGGEVGFVALGDDTIPAEIRTAVFARAPTEPEGCIGPVRLANPAGAALIWIGERRPAPGWDEMSQRVHNELRRRFLDECLTKTHLVTYLDDK